MSSISSEIETENLSPMSPPSSLEDLPGGGGSSDSFNTGSAVGLSNPHLSDGRRRMLDLVNRLHSTGVQVDIDLPQIAVIGSQSAGKSSLIESISGITLPRASGTCTRCPTECRLSRSKDPWKCVVKLRRTLPNGQLHSEYFGKPIYEHAKSEVEDRIRRAQLAILNPNKDAKYYLTVEDWELDPTESSFSKDCVTLEISGPDVADLSFCDLPGLIATVGTHGNKSDIDLIRSFVVTYIKKPSCIILLTVTCETDFQNQGAHELAKEYDPHGKRTIGVLTKPDRIPVGDEATWVSLIRNEKEHLENNWYCVRQPGPADLKEGITWTEARRREDNFFSTKQPWNELEAIYQKYLRTGNLVERLSSILSDLISKRLPEIQDELERSTLATRLALQTLPNEPSKDPQNEISNLLHSFVTDLVKHVEGVPEKDGLLQIIRPVQGIFRSAIRGTAPEFLPFEKRFSREKKLEKPDFLRDEEGGEEEEEGSYESSDDEGGRLSPIPERNGRANLICIDEVFERAHQSRTRELPGSYPFVVQETLIKAIIEQWNTPMQVLCNTVFSILVEYVKRLVTAHFGSFGQGGLEQRVKVLLQDHIKRCMNSTQERVTWILALEDRPFSLNTHYLADYKAKFLAYYKGAREKDRNATLMSAIQTYSPPAPSGVFRGSNRTSYSEPSAPTGIAKVLAGLVEIGIHGVRPEDLSKLIPPDGMEPALVIMADVRAYFQVAYKRFADNIPLAIDHELVRGITRNILSILNTGLGINGRDGLRICKELAQENPRVSSLREELRKKLERLDDASQELLKVGL